MPSDASIQPGGRTPPPRSTRIGGFLAGVFITLALGMLVSVAFTGNGLSTSKTPPEQIYFP